jgi:hypothetical protein
MIAMAGFSSRHGDRMLWSFFGHFYPENRRVRGVRAKPLNRARQTGLKLMSCFFAGDLIESICKSWVSDYRK